METDALEELFDKVCAYHQGQIYLKMILKRITKAN